MKKIISNVVLAIALCAISSIGNAKEINLKNIHIDFQPNTSEVQSWGVPSLIVDDKSQTVLNLKHQSLIIPRAIKNEEIIATEMGYEWQHDFSIEIKNGKLVVANESWQLVSQNVMKQGDIEHIADVFEYQDGSAECKENKCIWTDNRDGHWIVSFDIK